MILLSSVLLSTSLQAQVIPDGSYFISSVQSGDCVEIEKAEENGKIIQAVCEDKISQKFDLSHISDDNYTISTLAVGHNSKTNGAHIYNSNQADEFKIEQQGTSYKIKSTHSTKYITGKIHSNEIVQYNGHSSDAQLWDISTELTQESSGTLVYENSNEDTGFENYFIDTGIPANTIYMVTFDIKNVDLVSDNTQIIAGSNGDDHQGRFYVGAYNGIWRIGLGTSNYLEGTDLGLTLSSDTYKTIKIVREDNTVSVYEDDILKGSKTNSGLVTSNPFWMLNAYHPDHQNNWTNGTVKNIKIYTK